MVAILVLALAVGLVLLVSAAPAVLAQTATQGPARSGRELYHAACAACHGAEGAGRERSWVGFDTPLPDFTSCSFATREPNADWEQIVREGGPARAFDPLMPAFGGALTDAEIQRTIDYIRGYCPDPTWPRGDLNFPRALFTEKAFVEDEAVLTTAFGLEGAGAVASRFVWGQRFGARTQLELIIPFAVLEGQDDRWRAGLGDVAFGAKRVLLANVRTGTILSVAGEIIFPTSDEDRGFGQDVLRIEPFLALGQLLPLGGFAHLQGGAELPTDTEQASAAAFWRLALGRSFTWGRFERSWTPMIEVLGVRDLSEGERPQWSLVPQLQVTLSRRQHIMACAGVRIPLTDGGTRPTQLSVYLLWDWFDGGFFEGW